MSLEGNPFVKLFNSVEDAMEFIKNRDSILQDITEISEPYSTLTEVTAKPADVNDVEEPVKHASDLDLLEEVFLMTTKTDTNKFCMKNLKNVTADDIKERNLPFLVYERLMAAEELKEMTERDPNLRELPAFEIDPMKFLAECFVRLRAIREEIPTKDPADSSDPVTDCLSLMKEQALLLIELPDLLVDFSPTKHLSGLLRPGDLSTPETEIQLQFFSELAQDLSSDRMTEVFRPVLDGLLAEVEGIRREFREATIPRSFRFPVGLSFFARNPLLAEALFRYDEELMKRRSGQPEASLLGGLLSLGSSPEFFSVVSDYLDDPRSLVARNITDAEDGVRRCQEEVQTGMHELFRGLLKLGDRARAELLVWVGDVVHAYRDRSKLWNVQMSLYLPTTFSDNLLLNLQVVLLKSFAPFVSEPGSERLLLIQPTYCSAASLSREEALARNVHMREIPGTRLTPSSDGYSFQQQQQQSPSTSQEGASSSSTPQQEQQEKEQQHIQPPPLSSLAERYTLASELFFMIHTCFGVGFSVVHEKFMKLSQEMNQIRERYKELLDQGLGSSEPGIRLKEQLRTSLPIFYACKAGLMQPELLEKSFQFCILTGNFLVHVAMTTAADGTEGSQQGGKREVRRAEFPPPGDTGLTALRHVPEQVVRNVHSLMLLLRRSNDAFFEEHHEHLGSLWDFILLFMSGPQFIHNPHVRAEMAEALECLFPRREQQQPDQYRGTIFGSLLLDNFYRERLLSEHGNARHATRSIVELFVGMELTGHGVQFENKFRYRQPMYLMFEHLWALDEHKEALVDLARYAEDHLDDVDAPLFLRFINLLINDAIYLLDEALSLMSQIKEKSAQEAEWLELPANQRQEAEGAFRHLSLLARFHNIMGLETIRTLARLTAVVRSIFTRPVMVDRLAAMLNYFLLHLVGPKKRSLKVKNPEEYKFEPRLIVVEICRIYENLSGEEAFLRAVSRDGRSYSHGLFEQAADVLCKIKEPVDRIARLGEIAERIKELAGEEAKEEEELSDVPEDFLDPILGTLMRDPVLLPSSGKIVDRQTIARHILSDQSDPFNRQPLTMNMIKPADELRARIEEWIAQSKSRR